MNDGFPFTHPDEKEQKSNAQRFLNASQIKTAVSHIDTLIGEKSYLLKVARISAGLIDQRIARLEEEIADLMTSRDAHIENERLEA